MLEWENVEKPVENGPFESPIHFGNLCRFLAKGIAIGVPLFVFATICLLILVFKSFSSLICFLIGTALVVFLINLFSK